MSNVYIYEVSKPGYDAAPFVVVADSDWEAEIEILGWSIIVGFLYTLKEKMNGKEVSR